MDESPRDAEVRARRAADSELIRRTRSGERGAFDELAARYGDVVRQVVRRYASAAHEEDLAQQAWWTAYRSLDRLRDPGRFQAWLWGITARLCWKWSQRDGRHPVRAPLALHDLPADPEVGPPTLDHLEVRDRITRALASLPEAWQAPLMLRYLDGLSLDEIARTLERTPGSVRGALNRGTRALRERLLAVWNELNPERALPESAPQLLPSEIEEILGAHAGPIMVIGPDHRILATNAPYAEQTGYSAEDVRGRTCHAVSHGRETPCEGDEHPCPMRLIGRGREQVSVRHRHLLPDGAAQEVEVVTLPVDLPDEAAGGTVRYWVEFLHPLPEGASHPVAD